MAYVIWMRSLEQKERAERNDNWQKFIERQNEVICQGLKENTEALTRLMDRFDVHDRNTIEGFAVVLDRAKNKRETTPKQ